MNGNNVNFTVPENDDDFVIGKGFVVDVQQQNNNTEHRKKKKRGGGGIVKNIIWIVAILAVSVGIALGAIYIGADYLGIGFGRGADSVIEVELGSSTAAIAEKLNEAGAVKCPIAFRIYSRLKKYDGQYKYGLYTFNNEAGYEDLANMLMTEGAKAETVTVTVPEGTGINDYVKNVNGEEVTVPGIASILEKAGVCSKSDFLAAFDKIDYKSKLLKNVNEGKVYYNLEGYLFPETYNFYSYDSAECALLAVKRMISETEKRITDEMYARADELGYTMNEILTMASIIQMESGGNSPEIAAEMPNVAAVFYNRLKSDDFATLGSSPTCYYGESFRQDDGRYDTYKVEGLPPGPLCSPSIDAIKAALYPTENSPYYYFVTDAKGKFYYHTTAAQQNATINRLKKEKNWIYEYLK